MINHIDHDDHFGSVYKIAIHELVSEEKILKMMDLAIEQSDYTGLAALVLAALQRDFALATKKFINANIPGFGEGEH